KNRGNWKKEEDRRIIKLRNKGKKWDDVSSQLPGRTKVACSRRYAQYYREERLARNFIDYTY
ncbi:hypothetical protein B0J13DRAFT_461119, partial [Dactylonectria estremocensis]